MRTVNVTINFYYLAFETFILKIRFFFFFFICENNLVNYFREEERDISVSLNHYCIFCCSKFDIYAVVIKHKD